MSPRRRMWIGAGALGAAVAGVGAGITAQRRHLRSLADDDAYARLAEPLGGRPLTIVSADGTWLHAEAFGPDRSPALVLVHGWTEELSFWGPVIRRLVARGLPVIAYDLRGHGHSGAAAGGDYSLERFGEDVEAVLGAVGGDGERPTVVGHSLGGMSIAAWAVQHDPAARARAAALVNTGFGDLIAGNLVFGALAKWLNHPRLSRALLGSHVPLPPFSTPLQEAAIRRVAFGPAAGAAEVAFYERMLVQTPPDVRAAIGVALSEMDLWNAVAALTVPTLVIAGELDRLTPPAHARRIAAELPIPAGLIELPGTGHMAPLERPEELSELLERLVDETANRGDGAIVDTKAMPASAGGSL